MTSGRRAEHGRPASVRLRRHDPERPATPPPCPEATPDPLAAYRAKRSLERTPEPAGAVAPAPRRAALRRAPARRHAGCTSTCGSRWRACSAPGRCPRGRRTTPPEKRLAVHVEDHPLEYGDFEGLIPEGNYGAGAVIVWDRGRWVPVGDPARGAGERASCCSSSEGYKLHGLWTLVKLKKSREGLAPHQGAGRLGVGRAGRVRRRVGALRAHGRGPRGRGATAARPSAASSPASGAPRRAVEAEAVEADAGRDRRAGVLARRAGCSSPSSTATACWPRARGGERPAPHPERQRLHRRAFPRSLRAVAALPFDRLVLDGEVVALDERGPSQLPAAAGPGAPAPPDRHPPRRGRDVPVTYYAFDLLGFEDFDLRPLPLTARKALLQRVLPPVGRAPLPRARRGGRRGALPGGRAARARGRRGQEGGRALQGGPLAGWLKVRSRKTGDFVVVGFTAPKGSRGGFGALHLAEYVDGALTYAGRVGSGFTDKQLGEVSADAAAAPPARRRRASGPVPTEKGTTWVEPVLVCEVEYTEWTEEGLLRQPVFLRFRDDKRPEECVRAGRAGGRGRPTGERRRGRDERSGRLRIRRAKPTRRARTAGDGSPSSSPTSRRSSGPRTATPRATSSSTTARSRPGCCPICGTGRWC